jgi:hypothetical protein
MQRFLRSFPRDPIRHVPDDLLGDVLGRGRGLRGEGL